MSRVHVFFWNVLFNVADTSLVCVCVCASAGLMNQSAGRYPILLSLFLLLLK